MRITLLSFLFGLLSFAAPAAAADFSPGPDPSRIVLNPAADPSTGQLITWRTDALTTEGAAEYQPATGGSTTTVEATAGLPVSFIDWTYTAQHHTSRLTGLTPDTEYRYRVGSDGHWSDWFNFRTAKSEKAPWSMIYFGDAQNNLDVAWRPVVEKAFAKVPDAKLALHAGDLINKSSNDDEWGLWFQGMAGPAQTINQFPVTGNHEKSGDPAGDQFREHFATAGNGPATADATVYFTDYQGVRIVAIDGNGTALFDQIAFLESALATNPNPWSIVAFHQPIFSGAEGRDNPLNRHYLQPILDKYDVDLVLQGHDHVYARGVLNDDLDPKTGYSKGSVYTVAVAGPKYYELAPENDNNWTQNGATRQVAYEQTSTFQPITFDGDTLTYRSYIAAKGAASTAPGQVGDLLDAFTITRLPDGSKVVADGEVPPDLDPDPEPTATTLKVRKVTRNLKQGTAQITAVTNAPGKLSAGIGQSRLIRPVTRNVSAGRPVTLTIRAAAGRAVQLRRRGKLTVGVKLNFRPESGASRSLTRRITLQRSAGGR